MLILTNSTNKWCPRASTNLTRSTCSNPTPKTQQLRQKQNQAKAFTHSLKNLPRKRQMEQWKTKKMMMLKDKTTNPPTTTTLNPLIKLLSSSTWTQVSRRIDQLNNTPREIAKNHSLPKCHNLSKTRTTCQGIKTTRHCFQVLMHLISQSKKKAINLTSTLKSCRIPH